MTRIHIDFEASDPNLSHLLPDVKRRAIKVGVNEFGLSELGRLSPEQQKRVITAVENDPLVLDTWTICHFLLDHGLSLAEAVQAAGEQPSYGPGEGRRDEEIMASILAWLDVAVKTAQISQRLLRVLPDRSFETLPEPWLTYTREALTCYRASLENTKEYIHV